MLNYVAMQIVTFCIVFWENPSGSNTVGIINAATKGGWFPTIFGNAYTIKCYHCFSNYISSLCLYEIFQTGI